METNWLELATRRYPNLRYLGGNGSQVDCWVVLTRCKTDAGEGGWSPWSYVLRTDRAAAKLTLTKWNEDGCPHTCCAGKRKHSMWRLREDPSGLDVAWETIRNIEATDLAGRNNRY